ncbi:MAG: penicillin-binding protein 2 [Verrucomicrobiae bacterium]|nr:penicillin-binding protein 2 [Verrucomicrobiae bacterium]
MFRNTSNRIGFVCFLLASLFTFFAFRLVDLQVGGHEKFLKLAAEKHGFKQPIFAQRGAIYDRHGEALAVNVPVRTVTADGTRIKDPAALAHIAAPFLGVKESELLSRLSTKRPYVVIQNGVSELDATAMMNALETAKLQGLYLQEGAQRVYPNGKMLCHVLGFVDHNGHGVDGVEKVFDQALAGRNGYRHVEHDRKGVEIVLYRGQEQPAENGKNITLTIDMGLQAIVEKELDNAMATYHPAGATAVLIDPVTGEILAMASRPNYDPNHFNDATPEQMRNRAITDMYEPGSVFKIVATAGAINEGIVTENTPIFCEYGHFLYGGKILKEASHEAFGEIPVRDVLVHSSNIGAAKIALKMGDDKYYEYVRRFGFGEKTKIQLPGEISGLVNPPSRWDKLTLTRMAMGQSVAATAIQVVMAMSTIANRGKLMMPQLVCKSSDGSVPANSAVRREVVSSAVAEMINGALSDVVSKRGTAIQARVEGYTVAGKTGTAQKINPHGGYLNDRYIVSFAGYLPAENPRLAALVVVDDAHVASSANYGGLVAAPVFSKIGEASARYLDLPMNPAELTSTNKNN